MKKFSFLPFYVIFLAALVIAGVSCTKEGPQGPPGKDGEDGIDGQDGTAGCIQCHDNSQVIFSKVIQWEASTHATGGNFERNGTSCAPCHTSQGFLERMETGAQTTADDISNPNPPNCYTCHNIHDTYTPDDWALTYSDPVDYWQTGGKAGADLGKGNLCANCHQSRVISPWPVAGSGEIYSITNKRYGPHHGPVGNIIEGIGGYEVSGSMTYENSLHTSLVENSCVDCHMAEPYGAQSGGHVMSMGYEYHGEIEYNVAGCTECHGDDPDAIVELIEETQAEIDLLLSDLRTILLEDEILDSSNYVVVPIELTADQAGAVVNYKLVGEDRSGGVHNYKYAKALLTNSIESLQE